MPSRVTASLVEALRSYRAMPGARNRCTYRQGVAAERAFAALKSAAHAAGTSITAVALVLDGEG